MTDKMKKNYPEILAPAGSFEALKAAVSAGADAVYAGGSFFSARAFAGNFDTDSLVDAIGYCHLRDVKLYMTVNTLLKDDELKRLTEYVGPFYEAGLDAVLVQDLGAAAVLSENFRDLPLHASTQMSISSAYGAEYLKTLGFTRIVPARELKLSEIKSIKEKVDIEIETFVHGAMCYAYSGKCLFSSFAGGRSGNRGRCAQPCRQLYTAAGKREHAMSLKDMCAVEILPELIDAGIDSFKIEGRMKNPSYVAASVNAYKLARDFYLEQAVNESGQDKPETEKTGSGLSSAENEKYKAMAGKLKDELADIYNRGGFYPGYYHTENGPSMFAFERPNHNGTKIGCVENVKGPDVFIRLSKDLSAGDVVEIRTDAEDIELTSNADGAEGGIISLKGKNIRKIKKGNSVYRTRNNKLLDDIAEKIISKEKQVKVKAFVKAKTEKPLEITLFEGSDGNLPSAATVKGDAVRQAEKRPTEKNELLDKLLKTGGMEICVDAAEIEIDEDAFVPMSEFNNLRRKAAEEFCDIKIKSRSRIL